MKIFVDVLGSVIEVMVLIYFFNRVIGQQRSSKTVKIIVNLLYIILFTATSTLALSSNVVPVVAFSAIIMYSIILYDAKIIKKTLYSLMIFVFGILSEIIVGATVCAINNISVESSQTNVYFYLQAMLISKLLLFFLFRIIGLFEFNNKIEVNIKSLIAVLVIPIASIVIIYYFAMSAYKTESVVSTAVLMIVTILTILSNIATFYLLERQIKLQKTEETLCNLEKQYKLQADYYTELKQNMVLSNKNTHDIKNFVIAISSYVDNKKYDMVKSKIEEFYEKIPNSNKVETGNDAVSALVQSKLKDINEEIPNNNISIIIPGKIKIDEIDLCILIGNAVDNAVEACKKIEETENRMLEIKIFPVNGQLSMLFTNSKNSMEKKPPGLFKTTKADSFMHGFGIENMRNICRKYDGNISFDISANRFILSILLPN